MNYTIFFIFCGNQANKCESEKVQRGAHRQLGWSPALPVGFPITSKEKEL